MYFLLKYATLLNKGIKMTNNNVSIRSKYIDIPQDHNNETSCANEVKSFFAGSYRKICTGRNIARFCTYSLVGVVAGIIGMLSGILHNSQKLGSGYDGTSDITMKKSEYDNISFRTSVVSAFVASAISITIIWVSRVGESNQKDATNNPTNSRWV